MTVITGIHTKQVTTKTPTTLLRTFVGEVVKLLYDALKEARGRWRRMEEWRSLSRRVAGLTKYHVNL